MNINVNLNDRGRPHPPESFYEQRIKALDNIPTIPVIAAQIMKIAQDENKSLRQMVPIIEKDPPLAMKVLKMANTAYYGMRRTIESLRDAVMILGMDTLFQLALSFSVIKALESRDRSNSIQWDKFWEHSAAVGHIAELLKRALRISGMGNPFSLGLLHDVGKLILFRLEPEKYAEVVKLCTTDKSNLYEAEKQVFGICHQKAGMWIGEKWNLPMALQMAMRYHHTPQEAPEEYQETAALISLANMVANLNDMSFGAGFLQVIPRDEPAWQILQKANPHLEEMDFERFVMGIQDEVDNIMNIVKLIQQ